MRLTRLTVALALVLGLGGFLVDSSVVREHIALAEREPGVTGTVSDYVTNRPVAGATIGVEGATASVQTDQQGRYTLRLPPGEYEVVVSADGYITMSRVAQRVDTVLATRVDFELLPSKAGPEQQAAIEAKFRHDRELQQQAPVPNDGGPGSQAEMGYKIIPTLPLQESTDATGDSPVVAGVPVTITVLISSSPVVTRTMNFEDYLKGVVPAEVPALWPGETLKAQAVAARSYAATSNRYPRYGAQIGTTTETQAWSDKRYATTDAAVDATRGVVATAGGKIAQTLFFAQCRDGRTLDNEAVFSGKPIDYLRGVTCPHEATSQRGHGVGLCQYGSKAMAEPENGSATYAEIIAHYYRGIQLTGVSQPLPAPRARFPVANGTAPAAADLFVAWYPAGGEYQLSVVDTNGASISETPWTEQTTWRVGRLLPGRYTWRVRSRYGDAVTGDWSPPIPFQVANLPSKVNLPFVSRHGSP